MTHHSVQAAGPECRSHPKRCRHPFLAIVVLALVVAACSGTTGSQPPLDLGDPGAIHVHAIDQDPETGGLLVATHVGLYRIPAEGESPERIGDFGGELAAFAVLGPDRYVAGGHHDLRDERPDGQPPILGLAESTDGGLSWQSLSLEGDADLHAMTYAHYTYYVADATNGLVRVSSDGRTWETRSNFDPNDDLIVGLAVDPTDPDRVVAAREAGLTLSTDGGRSWKRSAAPPIVALSWDTRAGLWTATETGDIYRSDDGGATWTQSGSTGELTETLLATDDRLYAAGSDTRTVLVSEDGGQSWRAFAQLP